MRVPHQLLVLCVIGLAAATVARNLPESPDQLNRSADLELVLDDSTLISDSATGHDWLVQEPSRRTSRRPNFENPSKYNQRTSYGMLKTFGEAIGASWKST
ncbi:MAG: hypothetical protein IT423_12475, partial [Pirellulaceae bacterium]|nr:hypothetical protein [Pirellulaceae bacterium]